jgi:4-hydroxybenzoate polyprenyltransferase
MSQDGKLMANRIERTGPLHDQLLTWSVGVGEGVWNVFQYSSLYITTIALAEIGIAMVLLGLPLNFAPAVVALVTFAVYTNDRIADAGTDVLSNPRQAAFVRRYEHVLYPVAAAAYGLAVTISVLGGPLALVVTLVPGVFWILYASDWLDGFGGRVQRLKEILFVNTAVVALAWALTVTLLPLTFATGAAPAGVGFVLVYFFLRDFTHTEIPNIPDRLGDASIGVATIPVVYGIDGTRRALYLVDLLTGAVVGLAVATGALSVSLALPLVIAVGYSLVVASLVGRWSNERHLSKLAECEYPITLLGLIIVTAL